MPVLIDASNRVYHGHFTERFPKTHKQTNDRSFVIAVLSKSSVNCPCKIQQVVGSREQAYDRSKRLTAVSLFSRFYAHKEQPDDHEWSTRVDHGSSVLGYERRIDRSYNRSYERLTVSDGRLSRTNVTSNNERF